MFREPKWIVVQETASLAHFKGGEVDIGERLTKDDFDIIIPLHYVPELVQFLTEKGYITPQMSKESREEDIKIIHRLLDLCNKKIK